MTRFFLTSFVSFLLLPLVPANTNAQVPSSAQAGDPQAGQTFWEKDLQGVFCSRCHGAKGEGAFGPNLAGRGLSVAEFQRAVHKPWGVMPAFTEKQISDQTAANLAAYFASLPKVAEVGEWRVPVPSGAPHGQVLLIATGGCAQCHGPELAAPRRVAGGVAADANFAWFQKMVYTHTDEYPAGRMGNFSRNRLPEPLLQEIWTWVSTDLKLRVPVTAAAGTAVAAGANMTYTLNVGNQGTPGKGLTAEDVTISLVLPSGSTVASATGSGYQGVRRDPQSNADVAVWHVPAIAPADKQAYTVTLAGAPASSKGTIRWTKPALGGGAADSVEFTLAPPAAK